MNLVEFQSKFEEEWAKSGIEDDIDGDKISFVLCRARDLLKLQKYIYWLELAESMQEQVKEQSRWCTRI